MIRAAYSWLFTHLIHYSDPEVAHHVGLGAISAAGRCPLSRGLMRATIGHLDAIPTHETLNKDIPTPGEVVLKVRDLEYTNEWNKKMLDKVSFSLRSGEILGIAGVEGNGQRELVDILFKN